MRTFGNLHFISDSPEQSESFYLVVWFFRGPLKKWLVFWLPFKTTKKR